MEGSRYRLTGNDWNDQLRAQQTLPSSVLEFDQLYPVIILIKTALQAEAFPGCHQPRPAPEIEGCSNFERPAT